jgi:hypothetical protein
MGDGVMVGVEGTSVGVELGGGGSVGDGLGGTAVRVGLGGTILVVGLGGRAVEVVVAGAEPSGVRPHASTTTNMNEKPRQGNKCFFMRILLLSEHAKQN